MTFADIPPALIDATTSIEDKTFWENSGFDPAGFIAAAIDTIQGRDRGGSTITQQLVRARLLPSSAFDGSVYERKAKEIIQSIRLTEAYPGEAGKQLIIEKYLNQNFYGNRSYGVAAAAQQLLGQGPQGPHARADGDPRRASPSRPPASTSSRTRSRRTTRTRKGQTQTHLVVPPDQRDRPAPQLHPRPDEDAQRADRLARRFDSAASTTTPTRTPTTRRPRPSP